ncbi:MAG: hypothetical protein VX777_03105 [Chlamydiota bacterium]|nr:hypothetical protein [Chlamydiota bacterium]
MEYQKNTLFKEQTKEQSELVFQIIERSEGVEFSKSTFTIKNLEDNFRKQMESIFR